MDFLLSFRLFRPSVELKPIKVVESPYSYFSRSYYDSFLLLTVTSYKWKFYIFQTIFLRIFITTYVFTFTREKQTGKGLLWFDYLNMVCDISFLFDFLSALMYRFAHPKKSTHPLKLRTRLKRLVWRNILYEPRKIWMLLIDFFTIIPFELLRFLVPLEGNFRTICYYVPVLRMYRPIAFHFESMKRIILKTSLVLRLVFKCAMVWLMGMHIFTCIYRWAAWYRGSTFVKNIEAAISYDKDEPFNLFLVIYYVVQFSYENIGFGDLPPTTNGERTVIVIATLVGFSLLNGYIISSLTNAIGEKIRRITLYRLRLYLMAKELSYRKVPEEKIQKIMLFYHSLWTYRKGVGSSEAMLVSFPHSIWSSVYYDIFKNALNASLLFKSCDEPSKRAIARAMKTELYTSGDVILKRCRKNSRMFYIKKGTVEVMSHEDDETPIMTFGAGSIFGQIALLLSVPAISEIHAVAFCEIQVLTRKKLFTILKDYPETKDIIFNVHKNMLLNAMADKFSLKAEHNRIKPENVLIRTLFYKVPKEASQVAQNDICAVRTCPYVFEPQTIFLKLWEILVVIIIVVICFFYPYCAAFQRKYPTDAESFIILSDIILILNIYLNFSTAVVKENILFSSLHEIGTSNLTKFFTYVDILAIMPLHYFISNDSRVKPVVLCLRCLELHKIHFLFGKAESSVNMKMGVLLRLIKCIIYFFFIGYIVGILYYLEACYEDRCVVDSWYLKNEVTQKVQSPVWASLYIAILLVSETGFGDILPGNTIDVAFIICFCFFGAFLFIFLKSEFSAYLSLKREPMQNFLDFADRINDFLVTHKISQNEIIRVKQYLNLQWEWNEGYNFSESNELFYDTPKHMKIDLSRYTKFGSLQVLSHFIEMNENVYSVLTSAYKIIFPPHEVVIYADEVCKAVLILEEGFCELTYGKDVSVKKIIKAGEELCTVEILLGLTSLCHVRTLTHCIFLKIPKECLKGILKLHPLISTEIQDAVTEFKKTQIFQDIKKTRPTHLQLVVRPALQKSLYQFHYFRKHGTNEEYEAPYQKLGLCQWIRFLFGRSTVLPYGKLLKYWELSRCLFAFSSAMIFPLLPYFELQVPALYYIGLFLDISAWVDLYFRTHVCYYNSNRLLVSHPLYTAIYYLKGSFILDFTFCFPFDRIMFRRVHDYEGFAIVTNRPISILRLLRILQIYRIPPTVNNWGIDFLSPPTLLRVFIMMAAFTIIFLNTWTSILVLFCFNYKVDRDKNYELQITSYCVDHFNSIKKQLYATTEPFSIYLIDYYWVAGTAFSLGYGDITAETIEHMIFVICLIIISYLFLSFSSVVLVSFASSINMNLTMYQTRMNNLDRFLKAENVDPLLRKHTIKHFEEEWKKTKGMKTHKVFKNFHTTLENDILFHLFEDKLKKAGAFSKMNQSLIRILCSQIREYNFTEGAAIYKAKDAISEVFIISEGQVTLVGNNENETVTLGPSEIFGHLENVPKGLTDESAVATKYVTVLAITTTTLYKSYVDFSAAQRETKEAEEQKLREALIKSNELITDESLTKSTTKNKKSCAHILYVCSKYIIFFYLILSWFSINEVSYSLAFQPNSFGLRCVTTIIEVLFAFKILVGFTTGFVNKSGDFISDHRQIKRRYMTFRQFYVDFLSVIPFELLCYAFKPEDQLYAFTILRVPKYLRAWIIQQFFSLEFETVRVNLVLLKMLFVIVWSVTLLNQFACIWYFFSCHRSHCPDSVTWNIIDKGFDNKYLTSFYFVVVLLTSTGTSDVTPHIPLELVLSISLMIFAFFLAAIFTGQIISTISKYLLAKTNYEYAVFGLKTYLAVNDVSSETQGRVFRYICNIWRHERGLQLPKLLRDAPSYLIHEIKQSTYGFHINDNPVFGQCDPSFRNLIINELHRTVYFTGDVIVYEGEVDRTMYFVHIGLVESKNHGKAQPQNVYATGQFFGLKQGAYTAEPHVMTYTALTYCIILSLNLRHWQYLSKFYPQDVEHIRKETESNKWI